MRMFIGEFPATIKEQTSFAYISGMGKGEEDCAEFWVLVDLDKGNLKEINTDPAAKNHGYCIAIKYILNAANYYGYMCFRFDFSTAAKEYSRYLSHENNVKNCYSNNTNSFSKKYGISTGSEFAKLWHGKGHADQMMEFLGYYYGIGRIDGTLKGDGVKLCSMVLDNLDESEWQSFLDYLDTRNKNKDTWATTTTDGIKDLWSDWMADEQLIYNAIKDGIDVRRGKISQKEYEDKMKALEQQRAQNRVKAKNLITQGGASGLISIKPGNPTTFKDVISETVAGTDYYKPTDLDTDTETRVKGKASIILTTVTNIGMVISILILAILGIKYMLGSVEEKAEYKKDMIPYLVGAGLAFGITAIVKILMEFGDKINTV